MDKLDNFGRVFFWVLMFLIAGFEIPVNPIRGLLFLAIAIASDYTIWKHGGRNG